MVHELPLGEVALIWSAGRNRRAIVETPWRDVALIWRRVLATLPGGRDQIPHVAARLHELDRDRGAGDIVVVLGDHLFGLVRPRLAGPLDRAALHLGLARRGSHIAGPLVYSASSAARAYAAALNAATGTKLPWEHWEAETAEGAGETTRRFGPSSLREFRTELERVLYDYRTASRRAA